MSAYLFIKPIQIATATPIHISPLIKKNIKPATPMRFSHSFALLSPVVSSSLFIAKLRGRFENDFVSALLHSPFPAAVQ